MTRDDCTIMMKFILLLNFFVCAILLHLLGGQSRRSTYLRFVFCVSYGSGISVTCSEIIDFLFVAAGLFIPFFWFLLSRFGESWRAGVDNNVPDFIIRIINPGRQGGGHAGQSWNAARQKQIHHKKVHFRAIVPTGGCWLLLARLLSCFPEIRWQVVRNEGNVSFFLLRGVN